MSDKILTEDELSQLAERYTPDEIPPCRVCGAPLTIGAMGGGAATKWACSAASVTGPYPEDIATDQQKRTYRRAQMDHYSASKWTEYRSGDGWVLALIAEVRKLRGQADSDFDAAVEWLINSGEVSTDALAQFNRIAQGKEQAP